MTVRRDVEWDALESERQDGLLDAKRGLEALDRQRAGWEPDWQLRVAMMREAREEAFGEACRRAQLERASRPGESEARAERMRSAWARGAFAGRRKRCPKMTPDAVRKARRLREQGRTLAEVGQMVGVAPYTVAKWLGWQRKAEPTNRRPIVVGGIAYPSLREAERATGISRWRLSR
jgi:hypothetical protein